MMTPDYIIIIKKNLISFLVKVLGKQMRRMYQFDILIQLCSVNFFFYMPKNMRAICGCKSTEQ